MATAIPPPSAHLGRTQRQQRLLSNFSLAGALTHRQRVIPPKRNSLRSSRLSFSVTSAKTQVNEGEGGRTQQGKNEEEEIESPFTVLSYIRSQYNDIMVVDTPTSRVLLLDETHNVHSILYKEQILTGSYWDESATLPAVIPEGPIAILGLGGGTAAHIMLDMWPSLRLMGWEIDPILIDKARDYFGLSSLEQPNEAGGFLSVHIGDALSPSVSVPGGFAGIVVDLFSDGMVLPQLQETNTWLELEKKLMPQGRIMINCGGSNSDGSKNNRTWRNNSTIVTMSEVFGQLSWKVMATTESENYLALTGPTPDFDFWSKMVPSPLTSHVREWKPCAL
ncbi:uncharacterized protein LOC144716556 [Wolffia australiana]